MKSRLMVVLFILCSNNITNGSAKPRKSAAKSAASKDRAARVQTRSLKSENQLLKAALLAKEKEIKLLEEKNAHLKNVASHHLQAGYYD